MSPELITDAYPTEDIAVSLPDDETGQEQTSACSDFSSDVPLSGGRTIHHFAVAAVRRHKLRRVEDCLFGFGVGVFGCLWIFMVNVYIYGNIRNETVALLGLVGCGVFVLAAAVNHRAGKVFREAL